MAISLTRREFVSLSLLELAAARVTLGDDAAAQVKSKDRWPFYAMDTGLRGPDVPTLQDKVKLLHELGYWGIDYTLNHDELPKLLPLLDQYDIQLACVYLSPALEDAPDARLAESIKRMKGRPTRIELAIRSTKLKSSDPAGDERALELVRRISDLAADHGPVVSIYPHTGAWAERVQDGVRLAEKSGRKNVGANFNLVHWTWVKQDQPLEQVLKAALAHLFAVSINGLSGHDIVPLDEGNFDVTGFMRILKKIGYRGPVGLQGYGIPGPSRRLLEHSMAKWRAILQELNTP